MATPIQRKNLRKKRSALKKSGFLPFEIKELTSTLRTFPDGKRKKVKPIPLNNPFIKDMIRKRAKAFRRAKKEMRDDKGILLKPKAFLREYRELIFENLYLSNNWINRQGNADFWQMLRKFEDDWKIRNPEYNRPEKKTRTSIGKQEVLDQKAIQEEKQLRKQRQVDNIEFLRMFEEEE